MLGVGLADQIADEAQVERALQVPVEVVRRDEVLQRHGRQRSERPLLGSHHGGRSFRVAGQQRERHPRTGPGLFQQAGPVSAKADDLHDCRVVTHK